MPRRGCCWITWPDERWSRHRRTGTAGTSCPSRRAFAVRAASWSHCATPTRSSASAATTCSQPGPWRRLSSGATGSKAGCSAPATPGPRRPSPLGWERRASSCDTGTTVRPTAQEVGMVRGEDLVGFLHCDLSGLNRGRSVPASEVEGRMGAGVGWVPADQALTPFGPIAEPNPFGSLGDLRLLPDGSTETRVDLWDDVSPLHFYLCDAANTDGSPWDSCPRTLLKGALTQLEEAGFRLVASFEQEFLLQGLPGEPGPGFSYEAQRLVEPSGPLLMGALRGAGLEPEAFLPEYGAAQYEVPCAPAEGVAAADRAAAMREVTREVARRLGYRASFAPMSDPEGVGNGVHVHLSLVDRDGRPVFYDPD